MGLRFTRGLLLPVLMAGPWAQADRRPQPAISELEVDEDGLAILRVDASKGLALRGDYFTERQRSGTLSLTRRRGNPWWALWK